MYAETHQIATLVHKHLQEDISKKEQEELIQWVEGSGKQLLFSEITSEEWLKKGLGSFFEFETQSGEDWKKVKGFLFGEKPASYVKRIPPWARYAIASCLVVVTLAISLRIFLPGTPIQESTISNGLNSIKPGKTHAILALADGRIVPLDDLSNGLVSNQGSVKIIKQKGHILYVKKGKDFGSPIEKNEPGNTRPAPQYNTLTTPIGGEYTITLPDSTKVWLNANSSIRYPTEFTEDYRKVYLAGEAYFEVQHDVVKPFIVFVSRNNENETSEFHVTGTKFNINAYDNEPGIVATVIEGSIVAYINGQEFNLQRGDQLHNLNSQYIVSHDVNGNVLITWKNGYFQLDQIPFETFLHQLERWYEIKIIYESHYDRKFTGKIPLNGSFGDILEVLKINGYSVAVNGRTVTLTDRK